MAEVRDRGQLLLVGGVILAVFFVALALLVNTAIYTDNVATRGGDSASEALDYQDGVVSAVGGLLDAENADNTHDNTSEIMTAVESGTEEIDETMRQQHLRRGAATNVSVGSISENTTEGLLIRQPDAEEFEDWTVNASAARKFVIEFNESEGDGFGIELNDTRLDFTEESGDLVIEQDGVDLCRADNSEPIQFDVTAQRLDGEPCPFEWPELDDDSQIRFVGGDNAAGSYELTVATDEDDPSDVGTEAHVTEAVYSIEKLGLRYDSPDVSYVTKVRVAPGEPDV